MTSTHPEHGAATPRRRRLFRPIRAVFRDPEGKVILVSLGVLLTVGTIVYSILEGWSPLDSLYFSVVTLATVGYGDLHPTTDAAKVFTIGYILTGIGIVATFASELAKHRVPSVAEQPGDGSAVGRPPDAAAEPPPTDAPNPSR